jgi:hypothetical protein
VSLCLDTTGRYSADRTIDVLGEAKGPRYDYRLLHVRLCREGWLINRKRTYRVYHEAGLIVHRRKRKRIAELNDQRKWLRQIPARAG